MQSFGARLLVGLLLTVAAAIVAHAQSPKRVLMLHSFGPEFNDIYARDIRVRLGQQLPGQFELYEEWLPSSRSTDSQDDVAFAGYLSALFVDHPFDLVIALGAPAADFVQSYRQSLFRTTPALLTAVDQRRVPDLTLAPNSTAVARSENLPALVENILRLQPQTSTVAVVIGNSSTDRYWAAQLRDTLKPFTDRVTFTFLNGLSFSGLLKRAAALPPRSAILYVMLSREVPGIPQDEDAAFAALHAAANAPIFSFIDVYMGKGIVGGPMISAEEQDRAAASVAARMLSGEHAADIKTPPITLSKPEFDWRELKRWKIRESDLPPGSTILFREPSAWERYRWQMVSVGTILLLETALIFMLLRERGRRRVAEMESHQRLAELARMNRRSTVGELSASIAHELAQPLSAIQYNTEAAELILQAGPTTDLGEIKNILGEIRRDQNRAGEVIRRLRALLAKAPTETQEVDLNETVREVFGFLSAQAAADRVSLSINLAPRPLFVIGDGIQLQQVIMNLVMNSVEAIRNAASREREITARTALVDGALGEVTIEDSGPGLPPDKRQQLFEPFFTTKESGMGVGLSISETIVASHKGRIWAESRKGGAVFRFTIPLAARELGTSAVRSTVQIRNSPHSRHSI
jgi:signal transduction histidine kinase